MTMPDNIVRNAMERLNLLDIFTPKILWKRRLMGALLGSRPNLVD